MLLKVRTIPTSQMKSLSSRALSRRMVFHSELKISGQKLLCLVKEI